MADGLDLDGQAIAEGMTSDKVDAILGANHALARRLKVTGTPAFVMGEFLARGICLWRRWSNLSLKYAPQIKPQLKCWSAAGALIRSLEKGAVRCIYRG